MSNKLHPIYAALDKHQYSRAVKLASALPETNVLGRALLAMAHSKSSQHYKALIVLQNLLDPKREWAFELIRVIQSSEEYTTVPQQQQQPQPSSKAKTKGGKRGKKKPVAKAPNNTATETPKETEFDWIHHLDNLPVIPENWDNVDNVNDKNGIIFDETILSTLAIPLQAMRLHFTLYQMYSRAASCAVGRDLIHALTKSFFSGIRLLVDTSAATVRLQVLANMQVWALQLARLDGTTGGYYTSWAAQTALWQLEILPPEDNNPKRAMLPRLAESLALKAMNHEPESVLLYVETLRQQSKYQEMIEFLEKNTAALSSQQLMELKAEALTQLELYDQTQQVYGELIEEYVNQWSYWKEYLACVEKQEQDYKQVEARISEIDQSDPMPRAPMLMRVELAALGFRNSKDETKLGLLKDAIVDYATYWSARASCAFSDLDPYIRVVVENDQSNLVESLQAWSEKEQQESRQEHFEDEKEKRSQLRRYIFAVKLSCVLGIRLPNWRDLVNEWYATTLWNNTDDEVQKESQPGDELMLVAVKLLLSQSPNNVESSPSVENLSVAATILEWTLQNSPHNASVIISAIDVYIKLNGASRAYELYQRLSIKNLQLDSCSYLITSSLISCGLYQEALQLAQQILKLHISTAKDSSEYTCRALEKGTLTKANEFVKFQEQRMNASLALCEAKSIIMNCAPMVSFSTKQGSLALEHGIIGNVATDMERATNVGRQVHSWLGAPSIIASQKGQTVSDNRDLSILGHQMMQPIVPPGKEHMFSTCLQTGHLHGLLVRGAFCVDSCKGPKKGKIQAPSEELVKRCGSLLAAALSLEDLMITITTITKMEQRLIQVSCTLCRVLVVVCSGTPQDSDKVDGLSEREGRALKMLQSATSKVRAASSSLEQVGVAFVGGLLPSCLVPLFALLQMNAHVFQVYGWGKRKLKTKPGAAALADFALAMRKLATDLQTALLILPNTNEDDALRRKGTEENVLRCLEGTEISRDFVEEVALNIVQAQSTTRKRIHPYYGQLVLALDEFNVSDDT